MHRRYLITRISLSYRNSDDDDDVDGDIMDTSSDESAEEARPGK